MRPPISLLAIPLLILAAHAPPAGAAPTCLPPGTYDPVTCVSEEPDAGCPDAAGRTTADLLLGRGSLGGATGVVVTGTSDCDGDQALQARVLAPGVLVDASWTSAGTDALVQTRDGWTYVAWWGSPGQPGVLYAERGTAAGTTWHETAAPTGAPAPPAAPWGHALP